MLTRPLAATLASPPQHLIAAQPTPFRLQTKLNDYVSSADDPESLARRQELARMLEPLVLKQESPRELDLSRFLAEDIDGFLIGLCSCTELKGRIDTIVLPPGCSSLPEIVMSGLAHGGTVHLPGFKRSDLDASPLLDRNATLVITRAPHAKRPYVQIHTPPDLAVVSDQATQIVEWTREHFARDEVERRTDYAIQVIRDEPCAAEVLARAERAQPHQPAIQELASTFSNAEDMVLKRLATYLAARVTKKATQLPLLDLSDVSPQFIDVLDKRTTPSLHGRFEGIRLPAGMTALLRFAVPNWEQVRANVDFADSACRSADARRAKSIALVEHVRSHLK